MLYTTWYMYSLNVENERFLTSIMTNCRWVNCIIMTMNPCRHSTRIPHGYQACIVSNVDMGNASGIKEHHSEQTVNRYMIMKCVFCSL